ncbi:MAG: hypothetical protein Q9227_005590 [Pyrenula ochraceoflavens]
MFAGLTEPSSEVYRVYNGSAFLHDSSFHPTKELTLDDGDTTLVFLSADRVRYLEPVEDEWYAAHQRMPYSLETILDGTNETVSTPIYLADEPASVLGCKMSYQTCDPALSPEESCTPTGGRHDVDFSVMQPRTRKDRMVRWLWSATGIDIGSILMIMKSSSLTSRYRLLDKFQGTLPIGQWQHEVENWHNINLATLQGLLVDAATGSGDPEMLEYFWTPPNNTEEHYLCQNQKIISTVYTNFSLFWLTIVLLIGLVIILIEFSLESVVVFCERRGIIKVRSMEWFSNETLQLQRLAHEELGLGGLWKGCTGPCAIPFTEKGELLGVLDVSDREHPRLVKMSKQSVHNAKSSNNVCAPRINEESNSASESSGSQSSIQESDSADESSGSQTGGQESDTARTMKFKTNNDDIDNAEKVESSSSGSSTVTQVEASNFEPGK